MFKKLSELIKCSEKDAAYIIGCFYGNIKLSKRLSTFYGSESHIENLLSIQSFYVSRRGENYVCIESIKLSDLLHKGLSTIIRNWSITSQSNIDNFTKGYIEANKVTISLGNTSFDYIKGKKRILKEIEQQGDYITPFNKYHILYRPITASLKSIDDFDKLFNISISDQYKAIIGMILGDGHMKKT